MSNWSTEKTKRAPRTKSIQALTGDNYRIRFRLSMNVKMVFLLEENRPDEVSLRLD